MQSRFWGTRGSIPVPGPQTIRFGGNTSCVEVRTADGLLFVLDCGTGAHALGHALLADPNGPRHGHMFISHTHWDHIQGLPFMAPLFEADFEWDIYGPRGLGPSIRETLAGQMQYTYFPISVEQFAAKIRYHDLVEGSLRIGTARISTHYMNHPALTLGYRIEADGATLVYATDHEPHAPALAGGGRAPQSIDERQYADFINAADLLIHDAQFTLSEYEQHVGWGHSPAEFAVDMAVAGRVKQLALFHHDPLRDDAGVDLIVASARQRAVGTGLEVFGAAEGLVIELGASVATHAPLGPAASIAPQPLQNPMDRLVLIAANPEPERVLTAAVLADGGRVLSAQNADALLRLNAAQKPALVFLQRAFDARDALDFCGELRRTVGGGDARPEVVMIAARQQDVDVEAGVRAGVTDWLLWPFKETYARARMHCWALRQACRWSPAPLPEGEAKRLHALQSLHVLDTAPEERFDRFTRIAAGLFDVPIALVSLVDKDRQWFKSRHGIDATETPRDQALCAHAILNRAILQIPDALQDARFADNPLVTGPPRVRFYAGAPLAAADGSLVGTLCLIDQRARLLDERQLGLLHDLAALVEAELTHPTVGP